MLALAVMLVDYRLFRRAAWVFYGVVVVLLVLVLWKGRVVMGARRWISLGPVNFQPSELAKIAVILVLARWFSSDRESDPGAAPRGLAGIAIPLGADPRAGGAHPEAARPGHGAHHRRGRRHHDPLRRGALEDAGGPGQRRWCWRARAA